jgi:hypothetical protein
VASPWDSGVVVRPPAAGLDKPTWQSEGSRPGFFLWAALVARGEWKGGGSVVSLSKQGKKEERGDQLERLEEREGGRGVLVATWGSRGRGQLWRE